MKSTNDFSGRAGDYTAHRPPYPAGTIAILRDSISLQASDVVADVGAGTGILSKMLAENGNEVLAVEPNQDMRSEAEAYLKPFPRARVLSGSAEALPLDDKSVDIVSCAQSFHFFKKPEARKEFDRVLRDKGRIVLIWNSFHEESAGFYPAYIEILSRYTDKIKNLRTPDFVREQGLHEFFAPWGFEEKVTAFKERFSLERICGLTFSFSYVPRRDSSEGQALAGELSELFERTSREGVIEVSFANWVYSSHRRQR